MGYKSTIVYLTQTSLLHDIGASTQSVKAAQDKERECTWLILFFFCATVFAIAQRRRNKIITQQITDSAEV